jgi:hypothetical protein
MHVLLEEVAELEGIEKLLDQVSSIPITQGVVMDINPIWLFLYRLNRAGLAYRFPIARNEYNWLTEQLVNMESLEGDEIDFSWLDSDDVVKYFSSEFFSLQGGIESLPERHLPFIIKIIVKPISRELLSLRSELVEIARNQPFLTVVETRPLGHLAAAVGDKLTAGGVPGTLGGYLQDQNSGCIYATTCGHVASKKSSITIAGNQVGTCSYSHPPSVLSKGQVCSKGGNNTNALDLALLDLGATSSSNVVSGVASTITPHQNILMRGGVTKTTKFEVGGLVITYSPGNSNTCFSNMFEVRPPSSCGLLNPTLRTALASVPTQGDSGAWIETMGKEWCGILVAADHLMGYALEADTSLIEADRKFGTRLQLA